DACLPPAPLRSGAWVSAGMRTDAAAPSAPGCCLLIDANIPPWRYPRGVFDLGVARGPLRVAQLRQHGRAEQLQLVGLPDVPDAEQDVLDAGVPELAEVLDDLVGGLRAAGAVAAWVQAEQGRAFDVLVRAPQLLAVPAQDTELVHHR